MDERRSRGAKKIRNVEKKGEERMRANCRNCKHFIPRYKMTRSQLEEAMIRLKYYMPGAKLLGYCEAHNKPITYYEGSCYRYSPKHKEQGSMRLDAFLVGDS